MDTERLTKHLEGEYSKEVICKVQHMLKVLYLSSSTREDSSKNLPNTSELQTKAILLTLPKFIWETIEAIPPMGKTEGYEMFITLCTLLISEKVDKTIEDKSILKIIAEMVKELKLF